MRRINPYLKMTIGLMQEILREADYYNIKLDKFFDTMDKELIADLEKLYKKLEKEGKIDDLGRLSLRDYPEVYFVLKEFEREVDNRTSYEAWMMMQILTESMSQTYKTTYMKTYPIIGKDPVAFPQYNIRITDTYITERVLNIPWLKGDKTYSERIYSNVANFRDKLNFVLEEGITKGKGLDWMIKSWRKLTHTSAFEATRLLRTETQAMWSKAQKDAYLDMGIEYIEIIGEGACGAICVDYIGEVIPLRDAELGNDLPPYHPFCQCSYVAWEEEIDEKEPEDD